MQETLRGLFFKEGVREHLVSAIHSHLDEAMARDSPLAGNDVGQLRLGDAAAAAIGLPALLNVDLFELFGKLSRGAEAIVEEMERHGTEADKECLDYVLRRRAGSSERRFRLPEPSPCP